MKSIKKMTAIMILAAVATLSTPQAFAGIVITDRANTGDRSGLTLGDQAGLTLGDVVGIMLGDVAGIMLGD